MTPSSGSDGLVLNPTAGPSRKHRATAAVSYWTDRAPLGSRQFRTVNVGFGVARSLEASAFHADWSGPVRLQTTGLYLRTTLWQDRRSRSAVGLGMGLYQGELQGGTGHVMLRLPLTRSKPAVDLHAGLAANRWRGAGLKGSDLTPYVGLSLGIGNGWALTGEIRDRENWAGKNSAALAVRAPLSGRTLVTTGVINTGFSSELRPYVSVAYAFSGPGQTNGDSN